MHDLVQQPSVVANAMLQPAWRLVFVCISGSAIAVAGRWRTGSGWDTRTWERRGAVEGLCPVLEITFSIRIKLLMIMTSVVLRDDPCSSLRLSYESCKRSLGEAGHYEQALRRSELRPGVNGC